MDHGSIPVYIPHNVFLIDAEHSIYIGKWTCWINVSYNHKIRLVLLSRFSKKQFDWTSKGHLEHDLL